MTQPIYFAIVARPGNPEQSFTIERTSDAEAVAFAKAVAELTDGKFRLRVFRQKTNPWSRTCLFSEDFDNPRATGAFGA